MSDACLSGRKLRLLTVIDEFSRQSLAIEVDYRFPSWKVKDALARLFREHGAPDFLRSDNGPEFVAKGISTWLEDVGVQTRYIDPGKPWQNAFGESFNGTVRDECLNMEVFHSVQDARVIIGRWMRYYNDERLHSSLGYVTPDEFRRLWDKDLGALPPNPRDLSLWGHPDGSFLARPKKERPGSIEPGPSVLAPATALGSLPSVALSSGRAHDT
jgi:putative transposase